MFGVHVESIVRRLFTRMQTVTKVLTEIELKRGEGKGEEEGTRRKVDGIGWKKSEGTWKLLHIDGGKCAETFWDAC